MSLMSNQVFFSLNTMFINQIVLITFLTLSSSKNSVQPCAQRLVWDHDAQQLSGCTQPRRDERGGGPERDPQFQHQWGHVQLGEKPQQHGARCHRPGRKQEASLQPGSQDGGYRGSVTVEQEHTAA